MGTVGLMGSDDLLACFIAGNSFTWDDWFRIETEKAHLMEVSLFSFTWLLFIYLFFFFTKVVDILLNLSIFVYIGATMVLSIMIISKKNKRLKKNIVHL